MTNQDSIVIDKFYRVKVTDYGQNGELAFWYDEPLGREFRREAQLYPAPRAKAGEGLDVQTIDDDEETNEQRAYRRAKSKVRKLAMTMRADRILTLTTRAAITDREQANRLFVRFIKAVHVKYPNFKYVSVAEQHNSEKTSAEKRFSWHFHLAVSGWQDVGFLRAAWLNLIDGNIDVTSPRTKGDKSKSGPIIAAYLTKYMSKAFKENYELGKYRYRASNNIDIKTATFWLRADSWTSAIKESGNLLSDLYGGIGSAYLADDWNNGWFASWSLNSSFKTRAKAIRITS